MVWPLKGEPAAKDAVCGTVARRMALASSVAEADR